ncbi:DEKNAAC103427 [Brettanomyces naardenensis]|uniref:RNA helicase n=1 Tax=Brettanomyces naardenensis TaxID=13370 RepID=A0A448YNF3_BRENA|nr:DEKNAAC103427 [Brettanomyces naardenensis]
MARKNFYGKGGSRVSKVEEEEKSGGNEEVGGTGKGLKKAISDDDRNTRKRRLKDELREQHNKKISGQKKKRLNKYIEHQIKREEKEILLKKLEETRIDSSILKSAKLIGTGKQTKREKFQEAIELERKGKITDETKELLYEEREVKSWEDEIKSDGEDEEEQFRSTDDTRSSFINHMPLKTINASKQSSRITGFGFSNIPKVAKKKKKSKYTWRARVEAEKEKAKKDEEEGDFDSDEEEEEEEQEEEGDDDDESEAEEEKIDAAEDVSSDAAQEISSPRGHDFKQWAYEQAQKMNGGEKLTLTAAPADYKPLVRKEDLEDGLHDDYVPLDEDVDRKIFTVEVERSETIQSVRVQLPVFGEEYRIMDAIHNNDCVIICGETGSGKTTQVPQFLFESGYGSAGSETPGMIGVTEPRRVAAVSMAGRVSKELGNCGDKVAYQIRFDGNVKKDTALKFMTDGVLLREMMSDFLLTKYSAIIIDEAHERSVNTDILIGMLSRIIRLRREYHTRDPSRYKILKLIIMSATLRVSDFSENQVLFKIPPPILKVDARQYPVSIHFNRKTAFNYMEEAFRKTCKIHKRLPKGSILVFLTGKVEINDMVKRLRKEFPFKGEQEKVGDLPDVLVSSKNADVEAEEIELEVGEEELVDDFNEEEESEDEEGFEETLEDSQTAEDPLYVLPLYSLLPTKEQMKVFENPPKGSRLCVVATNVAETSLTIPGVRYVVDSGRSKERRYNEDTGVQSFEVSWISKASADQRSGRAGRTGPGHCYRIYSSALYESDFPKFSRPEILRMPVESVVLTMKSMGIDNIVNFPFPTSPGRNMLNKAEKLLGYLGALDSDKKITQFGKQMSLFPLSPRFSKMLLIGNQQECLPYIIALVSALSVGDPFLTEYDLGIEIKVEEKKERDDYNEDDDDDDDDKEKRHQPSGPSQSQLEERRNLLSKFNASRNMFGRLDRSSDSLRLLFAVCSSDHVKPEKRENFCMDNFLSVKLMNEIRKLRKQLTYIVRINTSKESVAASQVRDEDLRLDKPSKKQIQAIKQMVTSGFIDQIAVRADVISSDMRISTNTRIINIPYQTLFPSQLEEEADKFVYIHPSSILVQGGEIPPEYLVYQTLQRSSNTRGIGPRKLRIKPLNDIKGKALANVGKHSGLITYSKPLGHPYGPKDISPTERECYVVPRFGANIGTGGVGWDLPAVKVKQRKTSGRWTVE